MPTTPAEDAIIKNLAGPKTVKVDGVEVDQFGMSELIEADRYLGSKAALKSGLGVRIVRVEPPGATG